jgi:hypothetical protein
MGKTVKTVQPAQTESKATTPNAPATKADKQLHGAARDAKLKAEIKAEIKAEMNKLESFIQAELAAIAATSSASRQPAGPGVVATAAGAATSAATVLVTAAGVAGGMASNFVGGFLNAEIVGERVTDDGYLVRTRETLGGILRKEIAMTASAVIRGAGNGARDWAGIDTKGRPLVIDADEDEGWGWQEYGLTAVGTAAAAGAAVVGVRAWGNRDMDLEDDNVLPYAADGGV